jgi:hypothetical protein
MLDVYLDQTMPAVADWRDIHRPYLERARALIVVCTPGAKIDEGPEDWVHKEIGWWLEHRASVPILVDPLRQGIRYVPNVISGRWPDIQRIPLVEAEWTNLPEAELKEKATALRRQIVGNILPSGAAVYAAELKAERLRQQITQAALYDARAASCFDEARRLEFRWEAERQRQFELKRNLSAVSPHKASSAFRKQNLAFEIKQLGETMKKLAAAAAGPHKLGYEQLKLAEEAWDSIRRDGHTKEVSSRVPSNAPYIFSIEMINAGSGESILVHYGTPDETRLVMINGGSRTGFKDTVWKRLHALKDERFAGAPTPLELFVVGDQHEDKTGGLFELLMETTALAEKDRVAELRLVWVNIFQTMGFRGAIRELLQKTGIPVNAPFDHHVMSPGRGLVRCELPGGLEIMVIGPQLAQLHALYRKALTRDERSRQSLDPVVDQFPEERFSRITLCENCDPLPGPPPNSESDNCKPSDNARRRTKLESPDRSVGNMASTVLLLRYCGKTFLHTGDSQTDLILNGLVSSGLMEPEGCAHVDLLLLPHLGSNRNLSPEFLQRVTADRYLFSGNGVRSRRPDLAAVAALITARPCADYTMYFINRDSDIKKERREVDDEHTPLHDESVDAFFAAEEQYNPLYRRVFRATDDGSVIIDLLDRVTY